ncbi:MAG: Metal-dependent hydrolases of the beta-lactamase superfamily III, partial [uncultured Nocardioides sp.]
ETHRRGLLGLLSRPGVGRELLPARGAARGPHVAHRDGPRQRCPRRAAPVRRPARGRRRAAEPPARRPLPRPVRLPRAAQVPPARAAAAHSRLRARGHSRADGPRLRPPRGPGDDRGVRLPRVGGPRGHRALHRRGDPGRAPGAGLRAARHRRPGHAGLQRRHRPVCRAGGRRGRGRPPPRGGVVPGARRHPALDPPHRRRLRRGRRPGRGRAAGAHPHPALARPAGRARRGAGTVVRAARSRGARGDVRHL